MNTRCAHRSPATQLLVLLAVLVLGCRPAAEDVDSGNAPSAQVPAAPDRETQLAQAKVKPENKLPPEAKPQPLSEEELDEGWIALFDGHSLFGWTPQSDADWRVEDGAIVVDSGEKGLLTTNAQFGDYQLRLEFKADPQTNSGVFLHTPLQIGPEGVAKACYELNIAPADNPFPTGSFVQRKKAEEVEHHDRWRAYDVTLDGGKATVVLDGETVLEYEDPEPLGRGHIGLQLNEGKVAFRNIRLKPLGSKSLFNGKDLSGWKTYPDMASRFTVTDEGWLRVENGRGQLETEGKYGDFVLQLECFVNGDNLNSGVFFRCIPGETMNGYECQIHNGYKDGDRMQPVDCGTGGIFRRQDARRVAADDRQWFYLTLAADGPHMAAWVNGYQVSDWTDTRPPHKNPRNGQRLAPGTIIIQGHDPTTDLRFRDLQIAETPRRNDSEQ
ncbi:MAG: DUF1080 domain-containing protein [Planctomycetes bacterium]|nr:DUF1080 domain-containing protein [Planctomycetota bacterium]